MARLFRYLSPSDTSREGYLQTVGRQVRRAILFSLFSILIKGVAFAQPQTSSRGVEAQSAPGQGQATSSLFNALAARAKAAEVSQQYTTALNLYRRAVQLSPRWLEGWWSIGAISFNLGQFARARAAFLHFVALKPNQPGPGYGMLGLSEFQLKQYHPALAALERGRDFGLGTNLPFVHRALYCDGILFNYFGLPEIALMRLRNVANQIALENPKDPERAVLSDGELLNAFGLAALRIPKLPSEVDIYKTPVIREAGHAQALIAIEDNAKARDELKELVALYPTTPGVHYMYGVYLLKENPDKAIAQFHLELKISPKDVVVRVELALQYLNLGQYNRGLKYAQEAITQAPTNFVARVAYGKLLLQLGKTAPALEQLRIAVKLAPESPDARLALSEALARAGHNREAARERAEFVRLKAKANNPRLQVQPRRHQGQ